MKKKITARKQFRANANCRDMIASMNRILDRFATEQGFEDYCDMDIVSLQVGDDSVFLPFDPRTWDAAEEFLMFCVCHLIESEGLDEFPYYKEMADRYAAALGIERGSFE